MIHMKDLWLRTYPDVNLHSTAVCHLAIEIQVQNGLIIDEAVMKTDKVC
jgi:hypothetical protein